MPNLADALARLTSCPLFATRDADTPAAGAFVAWCFSRQPRDAARALGEVVGWDAAEVSAAAATLPAQMGPLLPGDDLVLPWAGRPSEVRTSSTGAFHHRELGDRGAGRAVDRAIAYLTLAPSAWVEHTWNLSEPASRDRSRARPLGATWGFSSLDVFAEALARRARGWSSSGEAWLAEAYAELFRALRDVRAAVLATSADAIVRAEMHAGLEKAGLATLTSSWVGEEIARRVEVALGDATDGVEVRVMTHPLWSASPTLSLRELAPEPRIGDAAEGAEGAEDAEGAEGRRGPDLRSLMLCAGAAHPGPSLDLDAARGSGSEDEWARAMAAWLRCEAVEAWANQRGVPTRIRPGRRQPSRRDAAVRRLELGLRSVDDAVDLLVTVARSWQGSPLPAPPPAGHGASTAS